jgi:EAL domain-containing protein (putative c-di-GMP-specific phosphodiesterase class I)
LLAELRTALELNQFELFYQPIINLQTGETMEAEVLLRWKHPDKGMVSPAAFIDIAEENNIIIDIGDWVVRNALTGLKRLQEVSSELNMAINTSPAHFRHQDCIEGWFKDIEEAGIAGEHLAFEITERLLMPSQEEKIGLQTVLEKIHQHGIKTSIDDFGTGYSSLAYIKRYNIDYVKIDKSFISSITHDEHDLAIVEAIIVMAHKLGMKVIAEGIENKEQQERLKSLGCDYAQGYYIGRPMPLNEMADYLSLQKSQQQLVD